MSDARILQLEAQLAARDRTIDALMRRVEQKVAAGPVGGFSLLQQNHLLQDAVRRKTEQIEAHRAELAATLEALRSEVPTARSIFYLVFAPEPIGRSQHQLITGTALTASSSGPWWVEVAVLDTKVKDGFQKHLVQLGIHANIDEGVVVRLRTYTTLLNAGLLPTGFQVQLTAL
jgi:hypothetical protein